jgi:hypothetical protein
MGLPCSIGALALDQYGNPVVSWSTNRGTDQRVYLRRWTGTSWDAVDGSDTGDGVGGAQTGDDSDPRHDIRGDELCLMWIHSDSTSFPTIHVVCTRLP